MATSAEYLTQLQTDKQTLVDNLNTKGVTATSDETFTSLVPKVLDIESGGGGYDTPTTDEEFNTQLTSLISSYVTYKESQINSYPVYTDAPITLYTPAATHTKYIIRRQYYSVYQVMWFPSYVWTYVSSSSGFYIGYPLFRTYSNVKIILPIPEDIFSPDNPLVYTNASSGEFNYYTSSSYASYEECINAIQDPNTVYTSSSVSNKVFGTYDSSTVVGERFVDYSNIPNLTTEISTRLSSNENIVSI